MRPRRSERKTRAELRERLEARREEIESAALARVNSIADPAEAPDPAYAEGLRASVSVALDYALDALERGENDTPPQVPVSLLAQARLAARNGVTVDAVLRRYIAGYSLLSYFVVEEAGRDGPMESAQLKRLASTAAGLFDRFIEAIGEQHARETEALRVSTGRRRAERIERLLAGELLDTSDIAYDFDGWHVGLVASGAGAEQFVLELVTALDSGRLTVPREEGVVWAWLGTRRELDPAEVLEAVASRNGGGRRLAIGELGKGLAGWRRSHRQAAVALPIAERTGSAARYRDVALLAAVHRDDLLASLLRRLYLDPLEAERDGGKSARETLRAYIAANRNVTSAAAAMGITRQSARGRLRTIEDRIGRGLDECALEIEVALGLDELNHRPNRRDGTHQGLRAAGACETDVDGD